MDRLFQPSTRRTFAALWAVGWLGVAALLLLPLPVSAPDGTDKLAHFLIFGGLAFAALSFSQRAGPLAGFALLTIAGGTALEFAQRLTTWRTFDLSDIAANAVGATSGYALALIILLYWIRPADPAQPAQF
jgi:VanZ family protein